ncbi:hypothetical protein [Bryobacter aggregatus]|uniref:hypothetical protein n=1 Tax=Bryobacter aggregatus TaxID=360054 RepID=UPI00068AA598|nr:hypothetical protein [Bryobacter aggregatus]
MKALAAVLFLTLGLEAAVNLKDPSPGEIELIIKKFAQKESEFSRARQNYVYRQVTKMNEFDAGRTRVIGKYEMTSDWGFSDGKRFEKIVYSPPQSLQNLLLEPEDLQDMRDTLPFVLTSEELDSYYVRYLGHELVDEVPCYVFAIRPKSIDSGKRYFSGTVWVDDQELQIVKTYGRPMGKKRHSTSQYPKFETYREQVDGKYWFPTYTVSTDTLMFDTGPVPIKLTIKYQDYKRFGAESDIKFGDAVEQPSQTPKPAPPKR